MDILKAASAYKDTTADSLELAAGRVFASTERLHDNPDVPDVIKQSLLNQAGDILEMTEVTAFATPGALVSTPIAALGSGTATATPPVASSPDTLSDTAKAQLEQARSVTGLSMDEFVTNFTNMVLPLSGLSVQQINARLSAMAMIADGTTAVKDSGTLQLEDDLGDANRDLAAKTTELTTLTRRVKPLLDPIDALTDNNVKTARMNGMKKIADGDTNINPDGTPVLPAPGAPDPLLAVLENERDSAITERDTALADLGTLQHRRDDLASHLTTVRGRNRGHLRELNTNQLEDETKTEFGL